MRFSAGPAPFEAILIGVLLLVPLDGARADDGDTPALAGPRAGHLVERIETHRPAKDWYEAPLDRAIRWFRKTPEREILLGAANGAGDPSWLREHFRVNLNKGLEYRQEFDVADQRVQLRLYGPVVKQRPGVGLLVRGLSVGEHEMQVKAWGNTKRAGLQFRFSF